MAITVASHGFVSLITLDRAEARNALSLDMRDALEAALLSFDADPAKRVAVLIGAGDKAFCAGADLTAAPPPATGPAAQLDRANRALVRDLNLSKPVIAAVNGLALGGGLELALLCDIRIAARNATFALTEVKIGSMPGSGGTQRLARLVGMGRAMHLALSGDRVGADDALAMGLVSQVVEQSELAAAAMQLAGRIADNAPLTVRASKITIREAVKPASERDAARVGAAIAACFASQDHAEGRKAFAEKRKPVFAGR